MLSSLDTYPPQTLDRDGVRVTLEFESIRDLEGGHIFRVTQPLTPGSRHLSSKLTWDGVISDPYDLGCVRFDAI